MIIADPVRVYTLHVVMALDILNRSNKFSPRVWDNLNETPEGLRLPHNCELRKEGFLGMLLKRQTGQTWYCEINDKFDD